MQFEPSPTLKSRTFIGLIIAQFLAAFNDQAIHASAMFFAIHHATLTQKQAITLMPILFYAPWAVFCTLAGFLADRYSKRNSLVVWKIAEIGITAVALCGFWLGSYHGNEYGPWLVLSTVFLMGTHSAFFVPAKYGVMPEILQPHLLSKGNGVLESTSFLAIILGTVCGGILSDERVFKGQEYYIGLILFGLALIGAVASMLIQSMPAANPRRVFRPNPFRPLWENLQIMLQSRPLALSVLGIAFFTFMVAFMRSTMYMHGETRNPHWSELHTSMVVATVALGVGMGSPLAGFFSGGKVELGLVPLGAIGMIIATAVAAFAVFFNPGLIGALVLIGFFSGFYIVPLYTLLQHRAPKTSKGDLIATSNFINVTGAIIASFLFYFLVTLANRSGLAPEVPQEEFARGELLDLQYRNGRPTYFKVRKANVSQIVEIPREKPLDENEDAAPNWRIEEAEVGEGPIDLGTGLKSRTDDQPGSEVIVTRYTLAREGTPVDHFMIRPAESALVPAYDNEILPRYLFLAAAAMTLAILLLLCRQLPDFIVRSVLWLRTHGRYRLKVIGLNNLPSNGPVILATNCVRFQDCMLVLAATDRYTRFVLVETDEDDEPRPLLRYLARQTGMIVLRGGAIDSQAWDNTRQIAGQTLLSGDVLGLTVENPGLSHETARLFQALAGQNGAILLLVFCGSPAKKNEPAAHSRGGKSIRVVIGRPMAPTSSVDDVRQAIKILRDWISQVDHTGETPATLMIPGAATALPKAPATGRPPLP